MPYNLLMRSMPPCLPGVPASPLLTPRTLPHHSRILKAPAKLTLEPSVCLLQIQTVVHKTAVRASRTVDLHGYHLPKTENMCSNYGSHYTLRNTDYNNKFRKKSEKYLKCQKTTSSHCGICLIWRQMRCQRMFICYPDKKYISSREKTPVEQTGG